MEAEPRVLKAAEVQRVLGQLLQFVGGPAQLLGLAGAQLYLVQFQHQACAVRVIELRGESHATAREAVGLATREQAQATATGRHAAFGGQLELAGLRGVVGDVGGDAAVRVFARRQQLRDFQVHQASTRAGQLVVDGAACDLVRECERAQRRAGVGHALHQGVALEDLQRFHQLLRGLVRQLCQQIYGRETPHHSSPAQYLERAVRQGFGAFADRACD